MIDIHNVTDSVKKIVPKQATNFWQDFKSFAFKGNMIDLAIGIIIGTAFNALVQSLVKDIIMPLVSRLLGKASFNDLVVILSKESFETVALAESAGVPVIKYGIFITSLIDFIILALTIFIVMKYLLRHMPAEKK